MTEKKKFPSIPLICLTILVLVALAIGMAVKDVSDRWKFVDAAWHGDAVEVRRFLDAGMPVDRPSVIGNGMRAIAMASYSGSAEVVLILLDAGANPTYGLPRAVAMDQVEIVRLLIRAGADVNRWEGHEETPLQYARRFAGKEGNKEIVAELKKAGAK